MVYASKSQQKIIPDQKVLSVEYHIIYSISYQVPVLYLRVFDESGRIFTDPDKVLEILSNPAQVDHLRSIKWEALTQQPHPVFQVNRGIHYFILFYFQGANKTENSLTDDMMRHGSNKIVKFLFYIIYDKHK